MTIECKCDMRTKLVGDGCSVCNPQVVIDCLEDQVKEQERQIESMTEILEDLEDMFDPTSRVGELIAKGLKEVR